MSDAPAGSGRVTTRAIGWSRVGDFGLSILSLGFAVPRVWAASRAGHDGDWVLCAHHAVVAVYMSIVAVLPIIRRAPLARTTGLRAKLVATLGSYFIITPLSLLPLTWSSDWLVTLSTLGLIGVGAVEIWALLTLRRSFSVFAEARKLITRGPYGVVRHPLYALYLLSSLFIALPRLSILAVLIAGLGAGAQMTRARREEMVLRSVFPEYAEYATRVPAFVPRFRRSATAEAPAWPVAATAAESPDEVLAA